MLAGGAQPGSELVVARIDHELLAGLGILDDDQRDDLLVPAIHDEAGYRIIREQLAAQYNLGNREPNVQIWSIDRRGDRSLTLRHLRRRGRPLTEAASEVVLHLRRLWGFAVRLETWEDDTRVGDIVECAA